MSIVVDMVGIVVTDLRRAIKFYRLVGLAFPDVAAGEDFVEVTTENGYRISLNAESLDKQLTPGWEEPRGQRVSLAFRCGSPAEVDRTYAAIERAGYKGRRAPWDAFWGQRYALVEDPDGSLVSLFAPLG